MKKPDKLDELYQTFCEEVRTHLSTHPLAQKGAKGMYYALLSLTDLKIYPRSMISQLPDNHVRKVIPLL